MTKITDLPEFDMADYLDNDEAVAQYLSVVLAEGDAGELADALGHIAKARAWRRSPRTPGWGERHSTRRCGRGRTRASIRSTGCARRWACG